MSSPESTSEKAS